MMSELEENSYFKSVVKDALNDLKDNGNAFVFFQEQVDAIRSLIKEEIEVKNDGTFFIITLKNFKKKRIT